MKDRAIQRSYKAAKEIYAAYGVDTDAVLLHFNEIPISIPCWQGDDIGGFEPNAGGASGGIMATGDYPGKPRTPDELRQDLEVAMSYIPGPIKVNLHASYGEGYEPDVDRDAYEPRHFAGWLKWAKEQNVALDFNATTFGHPLAKDGLTISHPDEKIRKFWVRHMIAARKIAAYIGRAQGKPCIYNTWVQDGMKDMPADRLLYRRLMKESFDEIFAEPVSKDHLYDALEPKLFGIGCESYTVGSNDFYLLYHMHARANGIGNTIINLDTGHYHPTESLADKVSSIMLFSDKFTAHCTRGIRWDSDHVVINDDTLNDFMREIVRANAVDNAFFGTDYFDATINRIAAWAIGTRAAKRALLGAMLEPTHLLKSAEQQGDYTTRLALMDEFRSLPANAVWRYYCVEKNVKPGAEWLDDLKVYEKEVMFKR